MNQTRGAFRLVLRLGFVSACLAWPAGADQAPAAPIPHSTVAAGKLDIARAWLAEPTERYPHGVLGDAIEAVALVVETPAGRRYIHRLNDGSVFEDLTPRVADIDGDGRSEVWTVRSAPGEGARLEAYTVSGDALVRRFAAAPIGRSFRWLNPVGIADFDGDRQLEAAYVRTPHLGGVLTILRVRGDRLEIVAERAGYSNHAIGSQRLDLSAMADIDNDGAVEILLPDQERRRLVLVSMSNAGIGERWRSAPGPRVAGGVRLEQRADGWFATYLTAGDERVSVPIAP